jgi:toxin FitB
MHLLDTNVISEMMRTPPDAGVQIWFDAQPAATLFLCSTVSMEVLFGIARLPAGRRKDALGGGFEAYVASLFEDRVLVFDLEASRICAQLMADHEARGHRIDVADAQIAATALRYGLTLATRNTAHFAHTGVSLVNPWQPAGA